MQIRSHTNGRSHTLFDALGPSHHHTKVKDDANRRIDESIRMPKYFFGLHGQGSLLWVNKEAWGQRLRAAPFNQSESVQCQLAAVMSRLLCRHQVPPMPSWQMASLELYTASSIRADEGKVPSSVDSLSPLAEQPSSRIFRRHSRSTSQLRRGCRLRPLKTVRRSLLPSIFCGRQMGVLPHTAVVQAASRSPHQLRAGSSFPTWLSI
jgi:hypothetical protein